MTTSKKKHYIYAEVPEAIKKMAKTKAKKKDLHVRQWLVKVIKEAE